MNPLKTIFYFLILSFFLIENLHGQLDLQNTQAPLLSEEQITIQTDRGLYITGEVLWFKIITIDKSTSKISTDSKVGYTELIAPNGTIIIRVKTELVNGKSAGSITLPKGINSNLYTLRSYTRMMRNFDSALFASKQVYILNSDQSLLSNDSIVSKSTNSKGHKIEDNNELQIDIKIQNQRVQQRELVELKIKTTSVAGINEPANLSISISIPNPIASDDYSSPETIDIPSLKSSNVLLPESIGMKLTGQVLNSLSNPSDENIRVYLSFPGKTALVYSTFTDGEGRFDFLLPRLYGQRQVVLQLDPKTASEHSIIIDDEFHVSPSTDVLPFVLPDNLLAIANRTLVNTQIADSYTPFEAVPEYLINDKFTSLPFYGKADKVYKLDDYTRFPLPEFFYEIVPEVSVSGKFGNNRLGIVNEYKIAQRELIPLLLVDGVPVFEQEHFLSINNKLIESSEIVRDPYWLNTILYHGIIHILSIDGDAGSFSLPASAHRTNFLTFLPERQFTVPDYSSKTDEKLPDFRNTLFWNPSITTDENGEASISFYTSDAIGEYEVKVDAINSSGKEGRASMLIEVLKFTK